MVEELTKLKLKEIIINSEENLIIKIKEKTLFKATGEEGLHLWEASIILSRYLLQNKNLLVNKSIIELGSGVGVLGASVLKWVPSIKKYTFSDYNDSVLGNLKDNLKLNNIYESDTIKLAKLDWRDYAQMECDKYDVIIGTELIYQGGAIEELCKLIKRILKPDGICYISMPLERSMTKKFLNFIISENMTYETIKFNELKISNKILFMPIIKDNSNKLFEDLEKMNIILYQIKKK